MRVFSRVRDIGQLACIFIFLTTQSLLGAPSWGEEWQLRQPDGSLVPVKIWGDEFYQRVESPQGYTLIRNSQGWISYATITNDGSEFIATDIIYTGTEPSNIRLTPGLDITGSSIMKKVLQRHIELFGTAENPYTTPDRQQKQIVGNIKGLTILIEFPDEAATIPKLEVEDFANKIGYTGNGNNGSVHDYFYDVSGTKLNYTNSVTEYYKAKNPKPYYDDSVNGKARELVTEAVQGVDAAGFDFSLLSNSGGTVSAVNVLYVGRTACGWAKGLWPHSGSITAVTVDGVKISRYQMTGLGTALSIGTFVHENGHMTCKFPDLYDYGSDSKGVGGFCVMCSGGGKNPVPPCAYLRNTAGWDTVTDITGIVAQTLFKHRANSNTSFIFKNPQNANESFYIESRVKKGRNTNLPEGGLAIWQVDTKGSNDNQQMTPTLHYKVSLEQADGLFNFEKNQSGTTKDLFSAGYKEVFDDNTAPNAHWWNDSPSGLKIANISAIKDTMSFVMNGTTAVLSNPVIARAAQSWYDRASATLRIRCSSFSTNHLDISIYSLSGAKIWSRHSAGNEADIRIGPAHGIALTPGIYCVSVGADDMIAPMVKVSVSY
jgi:M6 family metalloprotease-like protein